MLKCRIRQILLQFLTQILPWCFGVACVIIYSSTRTAHTQEAERQHSIRRNQYEEVREQLEDVVQHQSVQFRTVMNGLNCLYR